MMNYEKITALFDSETFKNEANACKTMDDFHKLFITNGVEITEEETVEFISKIAQKKQEMDNGEISDEALAEVSGGIVLTGAAAVFACIGVGALCIGAAAATAYVAYQALRWGNKHNH